MIMMRRARNLPIADAVNAAIERCAGAQKNIYEQVLCRAVGSGQLSEG